MNAQSPCSRRERATNPMPLIVCGQDSAPYSSPSCPLAKTTGKRRWRVERLEAADLVVVVVVGRDGEGKVAVGDWPRNPDSYDRQIFRNESPGPPSNGEWWAGKNSRRDEMGSSSARETAAQRVWVWNDFQTRRAAWLERDSRCNRYARIFVAERELRRSFRPPRLVLRERAESCCDTWCGEHQYGPLPPNRLSITR